MILTVGLSLIAVFQVVMCVLVWREGTRVKRRTAMRSALAPYDTTRRPRAVFAPGDSDADPT